MTGQPEYTPNRKELQIRRSLREHFQNIAMLCFFTFISVFFSGLAVYYIINYSTTPFFTLPLAVIWLVIVSLMIRRACKDHGGVRQFIVDQIGLLSRSQFVELFLCGPGAWVFRLGYRICGIPVYYGEVPLARITAVNWDAGQATSLAGRDMNDWHVTVWYKPEPPQKPRFPFGVRPEEDLYILGGESANGASKSEAAVCGIALVKFLSSVGIRLEKSADENRFVRFVVCGVNGNAT